MHFLLILATSNPDQTQTASTDQDMAKIISSYPNPARNRIRFRRKLGSLSDTNSDNKRGCECDTNSDFDPIQNRIPIRPKIGSRFQHKIGTDTKPDPSQNRILHKLGSESNTNFDPQHWLMFFQDLKQNRFKFAKIERYVHK